ncbi:MAG TPA: cytochrome c biogenesis protein CcdA [Vicinamibacteria bacterium]
MTTSVSILTAFAGGLASFVSPCVLPIVPGYLSFVSGVNVADLRGERPPRVVAARVAAACAAFVAGFSTVFVALGAAASLVGYYLQQYKRELGFAGGLVIILLGLHTMGVLPIRWLLYEKRAEVRTRPATLLGAYVVGLAFAFGWTPCIGPILGAILFYASQQDTMQEGVILLSAYSAGLGVPFLASGLAVNRFFAASVRLKRHMRAVERVSGALLVAVGVLLVTDRLAVLANYFARLFPALSRLG